MCTGVHMYDLYSVQYGKIVHARAHTTQACTLTPCQKSNNTYLHHVSNCILLHVSVYVYKTCTCTWTYTRTSRYTHVCTYGACPTAKGDRDKSPAKRNSCEKLPFRQKLKSPYRLLINDRNSGSHYVYTQVHLYTQGIWVYTCSHPYLTTKRLLSQPQKQKAKYKPC